MKKIQTTLCIVLMIFILIGCNSNHTSNRTVVNFYYRTEPVQHVSDSGIITVEARSTKASADDYQLLLEQYLNGAQTSGCVSPFPAGTSLKSFSVNDSGASVTLSPHLTLLSNADLSVACICLARTVFDMTGVQSVQISAQNNLLNGEQYITITDSNFVMEDIVTKIAE